MSFNRFKCSINFNNEARYVLDQAHKQRVSIEDIIEFEGYGALERAMLKATLKGLGK